MGAQGRAVRLVEHVDTEFFAILGDERITLTRLLQRLLRAEEQTPKR